MVYISLSLHKLLYWHLVEFTLNLFYASVSKTRIWWILLNISKLNSFFALNFELNLFCLFYLLFCSKNYVGTLRLLVAPQADASTILSQTHGIFNQVFYFFWKYLKVYSEPSRGFAMEFFVKTISGFQPLTVFA